MTDTSTPDEQAASVERDEDAADSAESEELTPEQMEARRMEHLGRLWRAGALGAWR
jgi:hypothetical protein